MNKKKSFIFWLVVLAFFCWSGLFLKPFLFGYDSYASFLCVGKSYCETLSFQPFAIYIFQQLPENLFLIKILNFLSIFSCLFIAWHIARLYFDEKTTKYAILVTIATSPVFILELSKFENEIFAYPLLFASIYFLLLHSINKKKYWFAKYCAIVFFVVSLGFWLPGLIYLIIFGLFFPILLLIIAFFAQQGINYFLSNGSSTETTLFYGLSVLFGWVLAPPFLFFVKNKLILFSGLIIFLIGALFPKFSLLFFPFAVISFGYLVNFLKKADSVLIFTKWVCFFLIFAWVIVVFISHPSNSDVYLVEELVFLSNESRIDFYADFTFDYLIINATNKPLPYALQTIKDYNSLETPFLALTTKNLNCQVVEDAPNFTEAKIYFCD